MLQANPASSGGNPCFSMGSGWITGHGKPTRFAKSFMRQTHVGSTSSQASGPKVHPLKRVLLSNGFIQGQLVSPIQNLELGYSSKGQAFAASRDNARVCLNQGSAFWLPQDRLEPRGAPTQNAHKKGYLMLGGLYSGWRVIPHGSKLSTYCQAADASSGRVFF